MKKATLIYLSFLLSTCFLNHSVQAEKLEYTILDERLTDSPIKTQVVLEILVSGKITKSNLEDLLGKLYSQHKSRIGFRFHTFPTNIYIYAFISRDHCKSGMGQWVAMLDKSYDDKTPTIRINERQIAHIEAKPEEKFGLSEKERRKIWTEMVFAEDRSWKEAERAAPLPDPFNPNYSQSFGRRQLEKQGKMQEKLNEKYMKKIEKRYNLTQEQLKEITVEGLQKDWPFPE